MRRHRWLLLLGFVLVASGCSGEQRFGVAARDDGGLEAYSYCENVGLAEVWVRTEAGRFGDQPGTVAEARDRVVLGPEVLEGIDRNEPISIEADYGNSGLFGVALETTLGELEPGMITITGLDPEVVPAEEFEDRKVSCGFDASTFAWLVGLAIGAFVVMIGGLAAGLVLLRSLLNRRRGTVSSF
ncbi:MAG: hypothetical protein AAGE98_08485 [Actinomycetota bacterium]